MRSDHPARRFTRIFSVTCLAVATTIVLLVMISFEIT